MIIICNNIFTMLNRSRDSIKLTKSLAIAIVLFAYRAERVSTLVLVIINPQRACARGLQYQSVSQSVCVCVSLFDFGECAVFRVETYISTL